MFNSDAVGFDTIFNASSTCRIELTIALTRWAQEMLYDRWSRKIAMGVKCFQ